MPASVIVAFPIRFEAQHRSPAAFDRTMILLNDVVQVAAVPDENILPPRIMPAQQPKRLMACARQA
jgi:hypothetical protein